MTEFASYSFDKVIVLVGGIPMSGWDEGDDVIQIERRVDAFSMTVGADGDGASSQSLDKSGDILLRFMQTSLSHTFLSAKMALMERGLLVSVPFLMKDRGSLVQVAAAPHCLLKKPAPQSWGTAVNSREWTLIAANLQFS